MRYFRAEIIIASPYNSVELKNYGPTSIKFDETYHILPFCFRDTVKQYHAAYQWLEANHPELLNSTERKRTNSTYNRELYTNIDFGLSIIYTGTQFKAQELDTVIQQAADQWSHSIVLHYTLAECTYSECVSLSDYPNPFQRTEQNEAYVKTALDVASMTHLFNNSGYGQNLFKDFTVTVPANITEQQIIKEAHNTKFSQALEKEIHALYSHAQKAAFLPVHYLFESDTPFDIKDPVEILISALNATGRLSCNHVFDLNIESILRGRWDKEKILPYMDESLVRCLKGNILLIHYGVSESGTSYDENCYMILSRIMQNLRAHLDATQVILVAPCKKPLVYKRLIEMLGAPVVIMQQSENAQLNALGASQAYEQLKKYAKKDKLKVTASLKQAFEKQLEDASFNDIESFYTSWKRKELIAQSFPEYKQESQALVQLQQTREPKEACAQLDQLIGLDSVKQQIKDIIARLLMNQKVKAAGLPVQTASLHCAFLGNPGTGKTEVAHIFGALLREAHVLKEGRVITVNGGGSSLGGLLLGKTIKELFDKARGSVLFFDEAYALKDHLTQIISLMEERRDDTVVIFAGYENEMNRFLDANVGMRSRLGSIIQFPDYTLQEKLEIFKLKCKQAHLKLPKNTESYVEEILARAGNKPDQGNARYVRKLFESILGAQQVRLAYSNQKGIPSKKALQTLLKEDAITADKTLTGAQPRNKNASAYKQLNELIGLNSVKQLVKERINLMKVQKARRNAGIEMPFIPMHMAFTGNPGTGKTEVARLIGKILKEEGVLSVGDFFECGKQDIISCFANATADKVTDLFEKARGSVIFIDEAYSLLYGQGTGAGDEAISTIIAQMENLRDQVVLILAGYPDEINTLLDANAGFRSRIKTNIFFPDYSKEELFRICELMLKRSHLRLGKGAREKINTMLEKALHDPQFGNARYVRNMIDNAIVNQATRVASHLSSRAGAFDKNFMQTLIAEDFVEVTSIKETHIRQIGFCG